MGSGKITSAMVLADRYGKMELFTKDTGKMIRQTVWEDSYKLAEMFMRENG
jgi:hypothetical protein